MWENTLLICSDGFLIWPGNVSAAVLLCHCCKKKKKILVIIKTKSLSLDPLLSLVRLPAITLRKHLAEGGQKLFSRSHISDQQVIVSERAGYHMKIRVFPSPPLSYCHCWLISVRTRVWAGPIAAVTSGIFTFYIVSISYHWYWKSLLFCSNKNGNVASKGRWVGNSSDS